LKRDTHESSTDPDSRLYKKSASMTAVPCYLGHVLTENRNGLVISALATQASTTAEREAALTMLDRTRKQRAKKATLGADKAYQHKAFLTALRRRRVKPHVAEYEPNPKWPSFLKPEERNDPGYAISLNKRKLVEKVFGWAKLDRALRQVKLRGLQRVDWLLRMVATAHNLLRMHSLTKPT
jgi:IS5 family transposase